MEINRGSLDALFTAFKTALKDGLGMATLPVEQIATVVNSTTAIEKYPFTAFLSQMRKWVGPRVLQNIQTQVLQLVNADYEHTVAVNRNDLEDDSYGLYTAMVQQMGQNAANLWGRLIKDALVGNANWLDGSPFFGTTRTYGDNTISNYVTTALSETTFNTAYQTMMEYVGYDDEPLGVVPDTLIVGPANRTVAHGIVNQGPGATAANPNAGVVDVVVHPLLVSTYDDYWFLGQFKGVLKPVILQKRKEGALTRLDKDTDTCVFEKNENQYGIHYRGAAALSMPHLIYAGYKS